MLEDFRLKIFITVAKEGSFTKAAAVLGITQPAVSQNIAELEKAAGTRLFERLRGEVVLTGQGKVFMDYASSIMNSCAAAGNVFSRLPAANVRISASEELFSFFLAPALDRFMTVHPDITFERTMFDDADLVLAMKPASDSPFEVPADSVARLRISISRPPEMGDYKATHEKTAYFDLLWQPSAAFACTHVCRVLKEFITSSF